MAYAQGELSGGQQMAEAVAEAVAQRMGGGDDMVQERDVERARKRSVH